MAGTALQLDVHALRQEVAFFLGKGRVWADIAEGERQSIDAIIDAGLRMFYGAYPWSFLHLAAEIELASGQAEYDLPDDFGFMQGNAVVTDGSVTWGVEQTGQSNIDMAVDKTGAPRVYAVFPKPIVDNRFGQFWGLSVWPKPDRDLTFHYRYNVQPRRITNNGELTANEPFPYGGMYHSETIREACLTKAESETEDQPGVHAQMYAAALERSIAFDKSLASPDSIGYNGDGRFVPREKRKIKLQMNGVDIGTTPPVVEKKLYWE